MKAIVPIGAALLVAGLGLLMTAASKPDYVEASGRLIEPFAYRVGGASWTALGAALLALHYLIRRRS